MSGEQPRLKALCVSRHRYLSDHFASYFAQLGLEAHPVVGVEDAVSVACSLEPDLVICEYELLTSQPLLAWEEDPTISRLAIVAVSLTRTAHEAHFLDVNGIAGFLYLPTLDPVAATGVLNAAAAATRARYVPAPATTSPLQEESRR